MATRFFCTDAVPEFSPTAGTKAGSLPKATHGDATNSGGEGSLTFYYGGTAASSRTTNCLGAVNQSYYFGRFSSIPLAAQTIPAQNWNWALVLGEGNSQANSYLWPVMYVWRPSTNSVVGYIVNTSAQAGTELVAGPATATRQYAGSAVTTQAGDILVAEVWTAGTPGNTTAHVQTLNVNTTASFIDSPYTLLFDNALIETFQENFESGLDTAKWTAITNGGTGTAEVVNGALEIKETAVTGGAGAGIESKKFFKIKDSSIFAKIVQPRRYAADLPGNDFTALNLQTPNAINRIGFSIDSDGNFRIVKYTNGAWGQVGSTIAAVYYTVASTHTWVRIRESAGTMYFDTAPLSAADPPLSGEWVNRASVATNTLPIDPLNVFVTNWVYTTIDRGLPIQPGIVDGINTGTGAAPARRRWFLTN